ncbi:hypothetical protein ACSSS7_004317 [Eimeria intestinalis]
MPKEWRALLLLSAAAGLLAASVPEALGVQLRLSPEARNLHRTQGLASQPAFEIPPHGFLQESSLKSRRSRKRSTRAGGGGESNSLWTPGPARVSMMFGGGNPFAEPLPSSGTEPEGDEDEGPAGGDPSRVFLERGGKKRAPHKLDPRARPLPPIPGQGPPQQPPQSPTYATVGPTSGDRGAGGGNDDYSLPFDAVRHGAPGGGASSSSGGGGGPEENIYSEPYDSLVKGSATGGPSGGTRRGGGAGGSEPIYAQPVKRRPRREGGGPGRDNRGGLVFSSDDEDTRGGGSGSGSFPPPSPGSQGSQGGELQRRSWNRVAQRKSRAGSGGKGGQGGSGRGRSRNSSLGGGNQNNPVAEETEDSGDEAPPPFKPPTPPGKK